MAQRTSGNFRFRLQGLAGEQALLACDDLVAFAVGPHKKRLDDAEAPDACDQFA